MLDKKKLINKVLIGEIRPVSSRYGVNNFQEYVTFEYEGITFEVIKYSGCMYEEDSDMITVLKGEEA